MEREAEGERERVFLTCTCEARERGVRTKGGGLNYSARDKHTYMCVDMRLLEVSTQKVDHKLLI